MSKTADASGETHTADASGDADGSKKTPFVFGNMVVPFVLLVCCFAAWGVAANMTDPLVKVFGKIFSMSTLQSSLVQFAYYGAYFCLALPAAFINRRFTYKTGTLVGLGLATAGAFMFYPASQMMTYGVFLLALFMLAGGLSILETTANPFVIAMGPEANATQRLNFAQAFNPVGTNIGVFLSATLILPQLNAASDAERADMAPEKLQSIQSAELNAVMVPYVGFACVLLIIWLVILFRRIPTDYETTVGDGDTVNLGPTLKRLLANAHYRYGVIAQFFNVAAQTCVWTFTIQYVQHAIGGNEAQAGDYLQASLLVFLVSRFLMTWLMGFIRPSLLLAVMSVLGTVLSLYAVFNPDLSGVVAVVAISACLSLMFPTIYGMALHGLGDDTKFGAAGLVMAILGGALIPMVHGATIDTYDAAISYIVPGLCFLVVAAYAMFDLMAARRSGI